MHSTTNSFIRAKKSSSLHRIGVITRAAGAECPTEDINFPGTWKILILSRKGVDEDEVGKVTQFETGITLEFDGDIAVQASATNSLLKHGYMLANGLQRINSKTPLFISLYKFRDGPDLDLPYEAIILTIIPRPEVLFQKKMHSLKKPSSFEDRESIYEHLAVTSTLS